jgi:glycosyltransferase involved in cell wall biosynthesis
MNPHLRICALGAATSPHVVARAEVFKRFGHEVVLLSPVAGEAEGLEIISAPRRQGGLRRLWTMIDIFGLVSSARADIFHAHYAADPTSWATWLLNKRPFVLSVMGGDVLFEEQGSLGPLGRWLTKATIRGADLVTVKSRLLAQRVIALGVDPKRVRQVIWGVDHAIFQPRGEARAAVRSSWGVPLAEPLAYSPRMLQPLYNQHVMVEALVHAPNVHLAISTFREDLDYGAYVRARARDCGVAERVVFVPGRAFREMAEAYCAADVILSMPSSDGFPQSVLEAMACGVPVVMSDLARYRERFEHRRSALFVSIEAVPVAAAMQELVDDSDLARRLTEEAAAIVARDCDFTSQAAAVEAEFQRLAARRSKR